MRKAPTPLSTLHGSWWRRGVSLYEARPVVPPAYFCVHCGPRWVRNGTMGITLPAVESGRRRGVDPFRGLLYRVPVRLWRATVRSGVCLRID